MSPRPSVFRKLLIIVLASVVGLCLALFADWTVSLVWRPALGGVTIEKPYVALDHGWYELRPNFVGADQFGPYIYPVETDAHGFRRKPRAAAAAAAAAAIFLGDSFVYGMNGPWEDTFVGMFAETSGQRVINAGVASYSPTAYLHQYRKALAARLLPPGHVVVVGIDISDVQDEAGIWIDGDVSPRKRTSAPAAVPAATAGPVGILPDISVGATPSTPMTAVDIRAALIDALPNTWAVYRYVRYDLLRWNRASITAFPRSAFTYQQWADLDQRPAAPGLEGYAPLGVRGGLARVEAKLLEIMTTAAQYDAKVYLLIYPWPAQLAHADTFSWSAFIAEVCRKGSCAGVVDTIPTLRRIAAEDRTWMNTYYVSGDTHFTAKGNRVVADALVKALLGNR